MRQHSLKTTYLIHKTLASDTELLKLISDKNIYLLVAEPETVFPYAIIKRDNVSTETGNKDMAGDRVSFSIKVYSDKYDVAINIADCMRFLIEGHVYQDNEIRLQNIKFISSSEAWVSDSYEQSMSFSAEVTNPINYN